jgi:MFS family permease
VLAAGLGALSAALALCALSEHGWSLSLGLALAGAASGVACGAAQAAIITAQPEHAERALNRWNAYAAAGDVLAPLLVAAVAYGGGSHRVALALIAGVTGVHACAAYRAPAASAACASSASDAAESAAPVPAPEGSARASHARLWLMLLAAATCTLLDEIVVALAALRLHEARCSPSLAAATLATYSIGGLAGALAAERALHVFSARRVLLVSALLSLATLALFIAATSALIAVPALFVLGAAAAPHHPLAQAAAYRLAPGRPGLVQALAQVFVVLEALMPLAIGALASWFGLSVALAALALQPLVMLLVALTPRRA